MAIEKNKAKCSECDWKGYQSQILKAVNPFDITDTIVGCPECKDVNTIRSVCDASKCWEEVTCGAPTPTGYRITCSKHYIETERGKENESDDKDDDKDEILRKEAIKKSIEKWEAIVSGTGRDAGTGDCALCELYYDSKDTESQTYACFKCPVRKKTGLTGCKGTPYIEWTKHHYEYNMISNHVQGFSGKKIHCSECSRLALKELDFLKSLVN